jgi:prophage regulatory protein
LTLAFSFASNFIAHQSKSKNAIRTVAGIFGVAMETNQSSGLTPKKSGALWRLPRVEQETGLMKSTIYKLMSEGKFVKSVKISARCVAWDSQAVMTWCEERIKASHKA